MSVYLAHPIDLAEDGLHGLVEETRQVLGGYGHAGRNFLVYDPEMAFKGNGPRLKLTPSLSAYIQEVNHAALVRSEVVVAVLPDGVPTVGTMLEISQARAHDIPVITVTDMDPARVTYLSQLAPYTSDVDELPDMVVKAMVRRESDRLVLREIKSPLPVTLDANAQMPTQGYSDDAGFDLYVTKDTTIPAPPRPGDAQMHQNPAFVDVPCGVRVQLPQGTWALITGRSSTIRNRGLLVVNSIIDAGYRGEYFAACQNMTNHPVQVKAGERIAQFIIMPALAGQYQPVQVPELAPSERGTSGFGSSGA